MNSLYEYNINVYEYNINVYELVKEIRENDNVKIEFYNDKSYSIMSENAKGYPNDLVYVARFDIFDFEDCNENIYEFTEWLNQCWKDGVEFRQCKIYVEWE